MTDTERLKELEAKATPGPWEAPEHLPTWIYGEQDGKTIHVADIRGWGCMTGKGSGALGWSEERADEKQRANAALIVEVRNALPALLDRLEALEAVAEAARRYTRCLSVIQQDKAHADLCQALAALEEKKC